MWRIRAFAFNLILFILTVILGLLCIPAILFGERVCIKLAMAWLDMVYPIEKYILGLDYHVIGAEHIPQGDNRYIVAMKHQSTWETLKLGKLFGYAAVVLKKELHDIPILGSYLKRTKMIPIDRSKGKQAFNLMLEYAQKTLDENRPIVIFPQGTRTPVGEKKPYKTGVVRMQSALNVPIIPVALNSGLFWPKGTFWKKSGIITVKVFPPISPGDEKANMALIEQLLEDESDKLAQL